MAGLDVHKKIVFVMVLQSSQSNQDHAGGIFGITHFGLKELAAFLQQHGVTHVAMESTAQSRRPVWMALEKRIYPDIGASAFDTSAPWP